MPSFTRNDDHVYVAMDFETTSLVPAASELIEIALIRFSGEKIIESYSTLVRAKNPVPDKVTEITGINDEMLANSPGFESVWPKLNAMIEGAYLVAHNAPFDLGFLASACRKINVEIPENPSFDTLLLSKRLLPGQKSYKLRDLAKNLNCPLPEHHRAMDDADFCRNLFLICLEKQSHGYEDITSKTLNELFVHQGGQLRCTDYHPSENELGETGKRLSEIMERSSTVWIQYSGQKKKRHIAPVYFYPMIKGITLKAYSILDNKYKDYYLGKIEITETPEGESIQSPWKGPRNL